MRSWNAAVELAEQQLGLATRRQLLACGLSDKQILHRRRRGELLDVFRGVYRLAGSDTNLALMAMAACLAIGRFAVVSHRTAAVLWGIHEIDRCPIEITVPSRAHVRLHGVTVYRSSILRKPDITRRRDLQLTTVPRTLVDLAGVVSEMTLEEAIDNAIVTRRTTVERLTSFANHRSFRTRRGAGRLRTLLNDRSEHGVSEVELERMAVRVIRYWRLPQPERQVRRRLSGRPVRFDLAYPRQCIGIELEGKGPHWDRWQSDHDRHNATELAGWRVFRFTWRDLVERPEIVATRIGLALGLRPARWVAS